MRRHEWIYATPAQESYIRRLRERAGMAAKWPPGQRRLLRSEASIEIEMLKEAIAKVQAYRFTKSEVGTLADAADRAVEKIMKQKEVAK